MLPVPTEGSSCPRLEQRFRAVAFKMLQTAQHWLLRVQVLEKWPEFRPFYIHSRRVFRHGLTLLEAQPLARVYRRTSMRLAGTA